MPREIPTLHSLCCDLVSTCVINLENVLDIVQWAQTHNIPQLVQRSEVFISNSFAGVLATHDAEELRRVLGGDTYEAMALEQRRVRAGQQNHVYNAHIL